MHETVETPPPRAAPLHRLRQYALLTRLHRPIGIYLLVWPMLWSLWWAAQGVPDLKVLAVFLLGAVLMRSAGCAINDFADRDLDGHVARTSSRPLATGAIRPWEAVLLFAVLTALAFALVLTMNTLTIWLSLGGVVLAVVYPFSKRYTHLPQLVLGAAFRMGSAHGVGSTDGRTRPCALAHLYCSGVVGGNLRHLVCDGRPE